MTEQERWNLEAELRELESSLYYSPEFGDWKIIKIYEYRLQNKPDPYDLETLETKRQEARDRINEIRDLLKEGE